MLYLKASAQLEYYEDGFGYNCDYDFPIMHTHDYWEFDYFQFDVSHYINGKETIIQPNTIVIIKPTDEHYIRGIPSKHNANKEPTHLNVKITQEKLKELLDVVDGHLYDALLHAPTITLHLGSCPSADVLKNFLFKLLWSTDKQQNLTILKTALFLMTGLVNQELYKTDFNANEATQEVDNVIKMMNSRDYFGATINEITARCNYSHMQLTRIFKKTTGMTMRDYFLNIKMAYATEQLRLTNKLTLDIANDIGISSLSHFNHIFKQKFGITPGEYRKKYRV